jgi:hypothetical protein
MEDPGSFFEDEFPSEFAFANCTAFPTENNGGSPTEPTFLTAVQFLTTTSTTRVNGGSSTSTPAQISNAATVVPATQTPAPSNAPNPPASENTASSTPATPPASSPVVIGSSETLTPISSAPPVQFVVSSSQTLSLQGTITVGTGISQTTIALITDEVGHTILSVGGQAPSTVVNSPTAANPVVIGSATLVPTPVLAASSVTTQLMVSGKPLVVGSSVVVGSGSAQTTVALSTDKAGNTVLNVGGQASTLDSVIPAGTAIVAGGVTIQASPVSAASPVFVVSGQSLSVQGSITVGSGASQTIVALTTNAAGETVLNAGGKLSTLATSQVTVAPIVVAGSTITPVAGSSGAFSVGGTVLSVGGGPVTVGVGSPSTTVLALSTDSAGHTVLISNGQSSTLSAPSITPAPNLVLFGSTVTANSLSLASEGFVVSGQTLSVGGTITIGSGTSATTLALQTDAAGHTVIVSNGQSSTIPAPAVGVAPLVIGGQTITAASLPASAAGFVVAGQTLTVGGSVTLGSGLSATTLALLEDAAGTTYIVSNGVSSQIAAPTPGLGPVTIGGQIISATPLPSGGAGFVVAGQTLSSGGTVVIGSGNSATTLALTTDGSGRTILVSNGHTSQIAAPTAGLGPLTIDGQTINANTLPSGGLGFIVAGQTLTAGGTVTIGSGSSATTLVLTTDGSGHTVIVSNGHTSVLPATTAQLIIINGETIAATALPSGHVGFVVSGQTLTQGGSITVSNTIFTLTTDSFGHTVLASNGQTSLLPSQTAAGPLTIEGQKITPTLLPSGLGSAYIIDGQTLTPDGSITISGHSFTLTTDPQGNTVLVSDGVTSTVPDASMAMATSGLMTVRTSRFVGPSATSTTKKSDGAKMVEGSSVLGISCALFVVVGDLFGFLG